MISASKEHVKTLKIFFCITFRKSIFQAQIGSSSGTEAVISLIFSFSDSEGAGGDTQLLPLAFSSLSPPSTYHTIPLSVSVSQSSALDQTHCPLWWLDVSVCHIDADTKTHIVTHTQRCPAVAVWRPDRLSFKGYVSIWCDNHDKDF